MESEEEEDEIASDSDDESGAEGDNSNPQEVRRRGAAFLPFHLSSLRPTTLLGRWMVHEDGARITNRCWHALGFIETLRSPESETLSSDHSSVIISKRGFRNEDSDR